MLNLIDTHCHLDMLKHKPLEQVLLDAYERRVAHMICIGAADGLDSADRAIALATTHDNIFASVGIHPHDANSEISISSLETQAQHQRVVAIGETGLDFFRDWSPFAEQERVFIESIALARRVNKPLIIHCRDAHQRCIELLKEHQANEVGGVFHCYAETAQMAAELAEMGFLISLTGILTFKAAESVRQAASEIPLSQIMLETDCPYMAPVPYRGKPSEPAHVYEIAMQLAEIKNTSLEEVAKVTSNNAKRLFKLPI